MLIVGVPREIKLFERRVGMTPEAVKQLSQQGVKVLIQKGAGAASGFSDQEYARSGATLAENAEEIYSLASLIQKVKEPQPAEYSLLKSHHILFCFLHLASPENVRLVESLVKSRATAVAFETLEEKGFLPLLAPMSEIAGGLSAAYAALFKNLNLVSNGKIVYPSDFHSKIEAIAEAFPGIHEKMPLGNAVLFGGGVAGQKALDIAGALNGHVTVIEKDEKKHGMLSGRAKAVYAPENCPEKVFEDADIFIGCVHIRGRRAVKVMDGTSLERFSRLKKKIIMDVSIDQGGNFPESHSTTYQDPLYLDSYGNLRFGVANIPSLCGRAASDALSKAALPYTIAMAANALKTFDQIPALKGALNAREGKILLDLGPERP